MFVTLTPNPSLDRTVTVNGPVVRGGVNRLESVRVEPGGKGLNVARVIAQRGLIADAVVPVNLEDPYIRSLAGIARISAGREGRADVQAAEGGAPCLTVHPVPVGHAVRVNTAVTEPDGTTTKLNEPGGRFSEKERAGVGNCLIETVAAALRRDCGGPGSGGDTAPSCVASQAHWVVLSGSLPPGIPHDWYAQLTVALHEDFPQVCVAVDTSDAPLTALSAAMSMDHLAAPDLLKPNTEELAQLSGLSADVAAAWEEQARHNEFTPIVSAARDLVEGGVGEVLTTLGPAGALLVCSDGAWHSTSPQVSVTSTVGAGDSALAGYILAAAHTPDKTQRLTSAVAHGAAAASLPGTGLPTPDQLTYCGIHITRIR